MPMCGESTERLLALIKEKLLKMHIKLLDITHSLTLCIWISRGEQVWGWRQEVACPNSKLKHTLCRLEYY